MSGPTTDRNGRRCARGAYVRFDDYGTPRVGKIESYDEDNPGYLQVAVYCLGIRSVLRLTNDDVEVLP